MKGLLVAVASVGALGAFTQAHAVTYFTVEANPSSQPAVKLSDAKDVTTDSAHEEGRGVAILDDTPSTFASGDSTIKPEKGDTLTDATFTPSDDKAFDDFSFRGQALVGGSTVTVDVWDQNGHEQTFTFDSEKNDQDFARFGIIGEPGETISKIEISDASGFKELKQFSFSLAPGVTGAVPEPSTWFLLIGGMFLLGTGLRMQRGLGLEQKLFE